MIPAGSSGFEHLSSQTATDTKSLRLTRARMRQTMSRCRIIFLAAAGLAGTAWTSACGDGATEPPPPEPPRATTVTVTPATAQLPALGATVQLSAQVFDQNGQAMAAAVTWSSSSAAVATIDASGLVTAAGNGAATITATAGSASGSATVTVVPNPDRAALVALYEATDGPNWVNSENWLTDAPLGDWYGVDTDASGRVFGLDLAGRWDSEARAWISHGLKGPIPPELGNLANLSRLSLHGNNLTGSIPPELGNLASLTSLNLEINDLVGPIPSELGNLASLTSLHLGINDLQGPILPELGNLTNLRRLSLYGNNLTGSIPTELTNLASLTYLNLSQNGLEGPIPSELANLANLTYLSLWANDLTDPIPPELGSLVNLTTLRLSRNDLSGPIPHSFLRLRRLDYVLMAGNNSLCVPGIAAFAAWLQGIESHDLESVTACNAVDEAALKDLYESAGGSGWTESARWLSDDGVDAWYGITTDSLGLVTELDLARNGLAGALPGSLGNLAEMILLRIGGNALSGRLPSSLARVPLQVLEYADTQLCAPAEEPFQAWLNGIPSYEGTGVQCAPLSDRDILAALYEATGGPNWTDNDNWLTDAPLREWDDIYVDGEGRVTHLFLDSHNLSGPIPPELGSLANLRGLYLANNPLTGPIPPELGKLTSLRALNLWGSNLTGTIPPELGKLTSLRYLALGKNVLEGPIPPELGDLASLESLSLLQNNLSGTIPPELGKLTGLERLRLGTNALEGPIPLELGNLSRLSGLLLHDNALTGPIPGELGRLASVESILLWGNELSGPIPPELGNLSTVKILSLSDNGLSGSIPSELGNLSSVTYLALDGNALTGPVPGALGNLSTLEELHLANNDLSGPVPPEFGGMSSLLELALANNPRMTGALPGELTSLTQLEALLAGDTGLCASSDPGIQAWLARVHKRRIKPCAEGDPPMAYLTQAVQSREFPVPLAAGEKALLRVFPTASQATSRGMSAVRARFFVNGRETHVEEIPGKSAAIPTEVDESSLSKSANAEIAGEVIQPGLEMVIEVDPQGTLDEGLGVAKRIPEMGRLAVDVRAMPLFDLTLIPFIWSETRNSSIVDLVEAMAADPENHDMLGDTQRLLPVGDLDVKAHEPVLSSSNSAFAIHDETKVIRAMEGGSGHYMGMMAWPVTGAGGVAVLPGRSSFSLPSARTIAHELGHNMNLQHAPCGTTGDASYPYPDGSIGVWGYDFRDGGSLVRPARPDLMSYCFLDQWISDYSFTNALRYRLFDEGPPAAAAIAASSKSLLLWGGVGADSVPFLEPAFVVDAPTALPDSAGEYRVTGRTTSGDELFYLSFTMPEVADGDGSSSFAFVVPVRPGWEENLASITLSGPGGSVTLDADSDRPMAILRNPRTGQVRGILRDVPDPAQTQAAAADVLGAGSGLEVIFSRGIPDAAAWRR